MKTKTTLVCVLLLCGAVAHGFNESPRPTQLHNVIDDSAKAFWGKFRAAVIRGDKPAVAALSQFSISMPYGMSPVRNRAQLIRRYRDVFNHDGSAAAKCFVDAPQEVDSARPNDFTVPCKNLAGDEVIIYSFTRTKNGWRFTGLDNINE